MENTTPPPKRGRPTKNPQPMVGRLHIRLTLEQLAAYTAMAGNMTVQDWARQALDRAVRLDAEG